MIRSIPIRRVGNAPSLFLGGDREVMMFASLIAFAFIFVSDDLMVALGGIALWVATIFCGRLAAKNDVHLRQIYMRTLHYQRYYPAYSTPFHVNRTSRKTLPKKQNK